jgi:hypothetical protein
MIVEFRFIDTNRNEFWADSFRIVLRASSSAPSAPPREFRQFLHPGQFKLIDSASICRFGRKIARTLVEELLRCTSPYECRK